MRKPEVGDTVRVFGSTTEPVVGEVIKVEPSIFKDSGKRSNLHEVVVSHPDGKLRVYWHGNEDDADRMEYVEKV